MSYFKNIVFCLSLLVYFSVANAQRCSPGIVLNISITTDSNLQWLAALNPDNCIITGYVINIFDLEERSELQYQTIASVLSLSLSDLNMCTKYFFEVHALTNQNVIGPSDRVNRTTPPATGLSYALNIQNATFNNSKIDVTWDTETLGASRCVSYYRFVYWDENNNPTDVYVPTPSFTITENIIPCMKYTFQVTAIITNPDTEGPLAELSWDGYNAVPNVPKLVTILTSSTTVNMTWTVPTYTETRCQLTGLVIETLGLPTGNSTSRIVIQDSALRPNVNVFLQDLTPNSVYTSYVSLQNTAGSSKNVTVTFQTSDSFVFSYERDLYYE